MEENEIFHNHQFVHKKDLLGGSSFAVNEQCLNNSLAKNFTHLFFIIQYVNTLMQYLVMSLNGASCH